MKTSFKILAAFTCFATAASSEAALTAYDSFEGYATGDLIGQTTSATGLTGTWAKATADAGQNYVINTGTSMSYSSGNVTVDGGSQYGTANFTGGTATEAGGIQLSTGLAATTGNTFYISFLFRMSGALGENDQIMFSLADTNSNHTTAPIAKAGFRGYNVAGGSEEFFMGYASGGTHIDGPGVSMGTTYLGVVKLTTRADNMWNTATLFINPTSTTAESGYSTSQLLPASGPTVNYFGFRLQQADSNDYLDLDELRIGTTWSDVVVPEPGTFAMFLGGIGMLALLRRRANN
jgi:hypothetical protein